MRHSAARSTPRALALAVLAVAIAAAAGCSSSGASASGQGLASGDSIGRNLFSSGGRAVARGPQPGRSHIAAVNER